MTRKNYELIAQSVKESFQDIKDFNPMASRDEIDEMKEHIVNNLASALRQDNPAFSREKFVKACGIIE